MTITLDQIKALRERTGVSITACKKALEEAGGDEDKAVEFLRKKGEAKAAERADRSAGEGVIAVVAASPQRAAMVRVGSETDFVAKNDDFVGTVKSFAEKVLAEGADVDLSNEVSELGLKSGEKVELGDVMIMESSDGVVGSYLHSNNKIGALVELTGGDEDLGKDIAMHIAATKPKNTSPTEVPAELVDKEMVIWKDELKESGKPEKIWPMILEGKEKKFREENALLTQPFVKNPDVTVGQLLEDKGASVGDFMCYAI